MTLVEYYDKSINHRDDEAGEYNHEAPHNIYLVIPNDIDLKNEDIKEELSGKSPSGYPTFQQDKPRQGYAEQFCNTRCENDEHSQ